MSKFKLVCFDMDGTLIRGTSANIYFSKLLGVDDKILDLEYKFKNQLIGSNDFMKHASIFMNGLSVNYIKNNFSNLPLINDIQETILRLKDVGIMTAIITSSNVFFANVLKKYILLIMCMGLSMKFYLREKSARELKLAGKRIKLYF